MSDDPFSPAVRLLGWAVHGSFAVLLAIAVAQVAGQGRAAVAAGGAVLGVLYLLGVGYERRDPRLRGTGTPARHALEWSWLGGLAVLWGALAFAAPEMVWIAFPLFFVCHYLLPLRAAVPAVAVLTLTAIAASARHTDPFTPAQVIGPSIGAAVATLMALAYRALHRESERRRMLIDDLVGTREKLVRAEREAAALAERERLAREIHDTLAQGMSSIILLLRAARRDLRTDGDAAAARLVEAERAAAENLEEARHFVRALTAPALQDAPLTEALRRIVRAASARTSTRVRFEVSGTPSPLPAEHELALLRIAQGALGNTARHAAAENAGVTLTYLDGAVILDVVDDGTGFDPSRTQGTGDGTGYGLRAMRDRAEALGGTLTVESAPGDGTAIAATLPLPTRTEPPQTTPQPNTAQANAAQPDATPPEAAQPEAAQPGAAQPDAAQPGAAQPGAAQPEAAQPDATHPDATHPEAAQPEVAQSGAAQPGAAQPGTAPPEVAQPGAAQPDATQPEAAQPGAAQPGVVQPGVVQPEAARAGAVEPDSGRPGAGVRGGRGRAGR
ncbi:histidine kinase [Spirillospora sp. NPDC029432]|uniref:sensor histidine kinase n=1 Tax=Spirillospora sp. NPDC029432 TaxID=3154599 RepID=UPI0034533BF2